MARTSKWTYRERTHSIRVCPELEISVHHHRDYDPDLWLYSTRGDIRLEATSCKTTDLEAAKEYALARVTSLLSCMYVAVIKAQS